jgi:hypothetical protein
MTLKKFLETHHAYQAALSEDRNTWYLLYHDKECFASVVQLPNAKELVIRPIDKSWDIGNGVGEAVFLLFESRHESPNSKNENK